VSTPPSSPKRYTRQSLAVGLMILLLACTLIGGFLAVIEYLTPLKPVTTAFGIVAERNEGASTPASAAAVSQLRPTFTPTAALLAPTSTPAPTLTPTPSPAPTSPPTATFTPTAPPTATPTATPTPTPTPDLRATEAAQAQATVVVLATARAQATARARKTTTAKAKAAPKKKPKSTPKPRPPRLKGRVAFPVFDPQRGTYDVYIAHVDGSGLQQIISEASQPDWRKDGQVMAIRRWKSDERGLAVLSFVDGQVQRLTTFLEDARPRWSPDGGDVIFFSRRESDRKSRIYRYAINGHSEIVLKDGLNVAFGESPSWTPDGHVAYRQIFPQTGIAIMDGYGGGPTLILEDGSATAPAVSPNGRYVVFMSQRDGNWELYRVKVDGSGLRRLTKNGANDGLPVWSGDSRSILFVSDRGGSWGMYAMSAGGGGQRLLFTLPGPIDGHVAREPDFVSRGWTEESISWIP